MSRFLFFSLLPGDRKKIYARKQQNTEKKRKGLGKKGADTNGAQKRESRFFGTVEKTATPKMHSVCKDLYKRDSPVNVFMNQIDPDLVLSLCSQALPPDGLSLFDPSEESPDFLRVWSLEAEKSAAKEYLPMSRLKAAALPNGENRVVTTATFHLPMSWLKAAALANV